MSKYTPEDILNNEYLKLQSQHFDALCLLNQLRNDLQTIGEIIEKINEEFILLNDESKEGI